MQPHDLAIPALHARSIVDAVAFYRRLGFAGGAHAYNGDYAILTRGSIEIHFFAHRDLEPAASSAGCYLRVLDVAEIYAACESAELPKQGIPRIDKLEDKPWGLREFAVVDPDGNLLRIGQVI